MEKIHSVAYQADVSETNAMQLDLESDDIQFESNQQLIDKYIDEVIDSPDINRDVLKEMFRELYSEALTLVEAE
jgi:tRNA uridine 5-carbamoylmethylation protein Kti12